MRRALTAITAALVLSLGTASVATAQDTGTDVVEEATNDDGDTGLIGLAGLLGLVGLFGLKRRNDHNQRDRTDANMRGRTDANMRDRTDTSVDARR